MDRDSIFLSVSQAVDAICIDFQQYDPQIMLFSEVIRLISGDSVHLKREGHKNGAWVTSSGRKSMKWLDGQQLVAFMCRSVKECQWDLRLLADVCRRVFQSRVEVTEHLETGEKGIAVETNMAGYACRQCGRCCRILDYHHELTAADVNRWKALQRHDILKWVHIEKDRPGNSVYRIWVNPRSAQIATPCPFLKYQASTTQWQCQIHDVKPAICRQYPISRKHAIMTGCRGFEAAIRGNKDDG